MIYNRIPESNCLCWCHYFAQCFLNVWFVMAFPNVPHIHYRSDSFRAVLGEDRPGSNTAGGASVMRMKSFFSPILHVLKILSAISCVHYIVKIKMSLSAKNVMFCRDYRCFKEHPIEGYLIFGHWHKRLDKMVSTLWNLPLVCVPSRYVVFNQDCDLCFHWTDLFVL